MATQSSARNDYTSLGLSILQQAKIIFLGVPFYNIFLLLFRVVMPVAAFFNPKARNWVRGRKRIFQRLEAAIGGQKQVIWMHCASLGEFEQGRPLLEKLKSLYPGHRFLLTFFSPSGYEVRKDYEGADWIFYLPMDGPRNAKRFLEIVNPCLVIFVKYEFWYYYLKKIKYRNIPLLLVSALFWKEMSFFKWYGALQRKMLSRFDHLFVQDETSKKLMDEIGLDSISSISGDTRFDRVIQIAEKSVSLPPIEYFTNHHPVIVAGSTWPEDEELLKQVMESLQAKSLRLIIAPHEMSTKHLESIKKLFPSSITYTDYLEGFEKDHLKEKNTIQFPILIIDRIGLLSSLYKYGTIAYIGGGFGKGIHNTLEAAVYGKPVVFGPVFHKFREAAGLIEKGGAFSINSAEDCSRIFGKLMAEKDEYTRACSNSRQYVYSNRGATQRIIDYIQEKRLLIN